MKKNNNTKVIIGEAPAKDFKSPWGEEERTKMEAEKAERNLSDNPKPFNCRKCGELFQPQANQFIFYDLCDKCFKLFDTQKMLGRTASLNKKGGYVHHFEDVTEWILKGDN